MPLEFGALNVMEYLWEALEKSPDGKTIRYLDLDIELLWNVGFVDTEKYPLKKWKEVFDPYKQADGSYVLDRNAFLSLGKYRYQGEIFVPFDAMNINEGFYTDEGLNDLIIASIAPSCSLSNSDLRNFFNELKNLFRAPDGLIKIERDAKLKIRDLLEKHPSPLRNLEILFDQMISSGKDGEVRGQFESKESDIATARAALETSMFTKSPTSKSHSAAMELKKLEKAKDKASATGSQEDVVLKKIRRSRKGLRG